MTPPPTQDGAVTLPTSLVSEFAECLGVGAQPSAGPDTLAEIYRRWCALVPYDNLLIRRALSTDPTAEVLGVPPERLLTGALRHRTGSQCTETAQAFHAFLQALGFDVRFGIGSFGGRTGRAELNHVSVLVGFGDELHLVDTVLLSGRPIVLRDHTEVVHAPLRYRTERRAEQWWILTSAPVRGTPMALRLLAESRDPEICAAIYRGVQGPGFKALNSSLYGRRNVDGEMLSFSHSQFHRTTLTGTTSTRCADMDSRRTALIEDFGFSADLVASIPADTKPPVPVTP